MNVIGTWRLVLVRTVDTDGREIPVPEDRSRIQGRFTAGTNGRMMAVVCDESDKLAPGQNRLFFAYCGDYTCRDGLLVTRVDLASNASMVGTDQVRHVRFENELLVLRPPSRKVAGKDVYDEVLWERLSER
jgi:hypothetical protein